MMTNANSVFFWATGQDDNIGDSLLRRAGLEMLFPGARRFVWVKGASEDFITGLGEVATSSLFASFSLWASRALKESLRRPTVIVLNAGEVPVSWRGAAKIAVLTILGVLARLRGGGLLWVGAGVPPTQRRAALAFYRAAARAAFYVRWRDPVSAKVVGFGSVGPDWAFALGSPSSDWPQPEQRRTLSIVLRGDRQPPSTTWWEWVDQTAERLDLDITLIVQVRRDGAYAAQVAAARGYRLVEWSTNATHAEQEERVRAVYRESRLVVGDRLHGLIVGATEGAAPLGWVESSKGKIARHFEAVGLSQVGSFEGMDAGAYPLLDQAFVAAAESDLANAVDQARAYLVGETAQLSGARDPRVAGTIGVGG